MVIELARTNDRERRFLNVKTGKVQICSQRTGVKGAGK